MTAEWICPGCGRTIIRVDADRPPGHGLCAACDMIGPERNRLIIALQERRITDREFQEQYAAAPARQRAQCQHPEGTPRDCPLRAWWPPSGLAVYYNAVTQHLEIMPADMCMSCRLCPAAWNFSGLAVERPAGHPISHLAD